MKQAKELAIAIKNITKVDEPVFVATVKSIDKNKDVVDVEYNDFELGEIRLQAIIKTNSKGIKFYPKNDSVVIVQRLGNRGEFFITQYSEVEQVVMAIDTTVFDIKNGFLIKRGGENMQKLLKDILDACISEKHLTNYGPTIGLTPNSVLKFTNLKIRVQNLFKNA